MEKTNFKPLKKRKITLNAKMDLNKKKTLKTGVSGLITKKDLDAKNGRKTQLPTFEKKRI